MRLGEVRGGGQGSRKWTDAGWDGESIGGWKWMEVDGSGVGVDGRWEAEVAGAGEPWMRFR